jgi:hypothetical protein
MYNKVKATMNTFDTDDIQQHILSVLDSAPIPDTRQLSYPNGLEADAESSSSEYQLAIKSSLDSLVGKEVRKKTGFWVFMGKIGTDLESRYSDGHLPNSQHRKPCSYSRGPIRGSIWKS